MYLVDTNVLQGIALKRRTDIRASAPLIAWLEQLRLDHSDRILPINDRIALEWGRLAGSRFRGVGQRANCGFYGSGRFGGRSGISSALTF
jgi:predicted nucleic acid-binding protein